MTFCGHSLHLVRRSLRAARGHRNTVWFWPHAVEQAEQGLPKVISGYWSHIIGQHHWACSYTPRPGDRPYTLPQLGGERGSAPFNTMGVPLSTGRQVHRALLAQFGLFWKQEQWTQEKIWFREVCEMGSFGGLLFLSVIFPFYFSFFDPSTLQFIPIIPRKPQFHHFLSLCGYWFSCLFRSSLSLANRALGAFFLSLHVVELWRTIRDIMLWC